MGRKGEQLSSNNNKKKNLMHTQKLKVELHFLKKEKGKKNPSIFMRNPYLGPGVYN